MSVRAILSLVLLVLVGVFTLQNTEVVTVRFLLWQVSLSRALLIFIVLAIGVMVGWVLAGVGRRRQR
jgi:putative membrane protein